MNTWFEKNEFNKEICDLIKRMKHNGYKTYGLSNTNIQFYEYIRKSDIAMYFDGFVISAIEKMMKPDRFFFGFIASFYGGKMLFWSGTVWPAGLCRICFNLYGMSAPVKKRATRPGHAGQTGWQKGR